MVCGCHQTTVGGTSRANLVSKDHGDMNEGNHDFAVPVNTNLVILQSIGIIVINKGGHLHSAEQFRVVTYTCRYSSRYLIPNSF